MPDILLAIETNRSRAPQLSNETVLNFLVERQPAEAKSQSPLFGCPGIADWLQAARDGPGPTQPCRGLWRWQNIAWGVFGDELWRLDATGVPVLSGSGIGGTNPVGISDNGIQMVFVNGAKGWTYDSTAGLELITSPNFYPAKTVTFMDGYFIFDRLGTNEFFLSDLYDGRTYSGLDFATAEGEPGLMTATAQNLQLLFLFTSTHIELWYDAGSASFPFQRYAGGIINYGCIAPYSIVKTDGALFFMGVDKVYYRLQANQPIRISTHAIEHMIAQEEFPEHAEAFTFTIEGHKLIFLTLPSLDETLCYDISTGKWHDRDSVDALFNSLGRYRGRFALEIYNSILIGDVFDGRVGKVRWDAYTEYGLPMRGRIDTINQHHDRKNIFCSCFELDVQAGVGLDNGQGSDPMVMVRRTIDGGMTYGMAQPWRSMGRVGEYTKRLRWKRQGRGREMAWRIEITDPVPRTIIQGLADIRVGVA